MLVKIDRKFLEILVETTDFHGDCLTCISECECGFDSECESCRLTCAVDAGRKVLDAR